MSHHLVTPMGLVWIAAVRVCIGAVLLLAARNSRMPRTLRALGVIALVAGVTVPLLGVDRVRSIVDWWTTQGNLLVRASGACATALGVFVASVSRYRARAA